MFWFDETLGVHEIAKLIHGKVLINIRLQKYLVIELKRRFNSFGLS